MPLKGGMEVSLSATSDQNYWSTVSDVVEGNKQ